MWHLDRVLCLLTLLGPAVASDPCTSDETICADDKGWSCCVDQESFCVPKGGGFAARCCPQWTVGCGSGSVGCCDPARPWQRDLNNVGIRSPVVGSSAAAVEATAYALFTSPSVANLDCLTIDVATGNITSKVPVSGPAKDYFAKLYGEITRVYPYSPSRNKFFFLDIVQTGATPSSPITLYSIDPATGASTSAVVSGVAGFVVSFDYHPESDRVVVAVGAREDVSFSFLTVDVDTAVASLLGTVDRGASEAASPAFYAPYITVMAQNGTSAYRLGYQQVSEAVGPGLGATPLAGGVATWEAVPSAPGLGFLYSMVRKPGTDAFVSLAPSSATNHTLSVVSWARGDASAAVLLDMANAHPPQMIGTGVLGYVADATSKSLYAALVVQPAKGSLFGEGDQWVLAFVEYDSGATGHVVIDGQGFAKLGAETVGVSGLGIKA